MHRLHIERHYAERIGWMRAAVLGANDGIVSTASLIVGVAAASTTRNAVVVAGVAGLVAGAMSMAAGEYVSVSSQADTEKADLERERKELETDDESERKELTMIYEKRGLDASLARQVADQLMAHDALGAHARDELGLSELHTARPIQAALASAATFAAGAALPLLMVFVSPVVPRPGGGCQFAGFPGTDGRPGSQGGRRQYLDRCRAGDLLGRTGHGHHRCDRGLVRDSGLISRNVYTYR